MIIVTCSVIRDTGYKTNERMDVVIDDDSLLDQKFIDAIRGVKPVPFDVTR